MRGLSALPAHLVFHDPEIDIHTDDQAPNRSNDFTNVCENTQRVRSAKQWLGRRTAQIRERQADSAGCRPTIEVNQPYLRTRRRAIRAGTIPVREKRSHREPSDVC